MREFLSKFRSLFTGRESISEDLEQEIQANIELATQDRLADGMSHEQARAAAARHFGNTTRIKENAREAWTFPRFETFLQDIRYGVRSLRGQKALAIIVILTLALGIGATASISSVVYYALLRPLPYPNGERLVWLGESTAKAQGISVTWVNYQHWRAENHSFEKMAAFEGSGQTLTGLGEPLLARALLVTPGFFPLLGERPLLGRTFTDADERPGAPATIVLTHRFWATRLKGNFDVLGKTFDLDGRPYQIIGVLPPVAEYLPWPVDFYLPLGLFEAKTVDRSQHGSIRAIGRLKPGITLASARADLDRIMQQLARSDPGPENDHRAYAEFLAENITHDIRRTLIMLAAAAGLVLLIACTNVTSLLLARSAARSREIAIRTAVGAGGMRLLRQLLTESVLLACFGGVLGILLARSSLRALIAAAPPDIPRVAETHLDVHVLVFAFAITAFTGLLVGLAPALTARKLDLATALKDNSSTTTANKAGQSLRGVLVIAEIAITLVLCFASALLIRHVIAAETSNPGFAPDHLLALELALPSSRYANDASVQIFYTRLLQDLAHLPGITDAGLVNCPPAGGDCSDWFYSVADRPAPPQADLPISLFNSAGPNYFRTMRIPMLEGRAFRDIDNRQGAPCVIIVNQTLANTWWPHESALGHVIKVGGPYMKGPLCEIVGVAGNVSQMGLATQPYPEIFRPFGQSPQSHMILMLRTAVDPRSLIPAVRRRVSAVDRNLPIESLEPLGKPLAATLDRRRFVTLLLSSFAAMAAILAAVGIYGLLNYWVRARESDIAVRIALGAETAEIIRWVGAHAFRLSAFGAALGLLSAWIVSRWMQNEIFGIASYIPVTMILAAILVAGITVIAAAFPAWRATRIDAVSKLQRA